MKKRKIWIIVLVLIILIILEMVFITKKSKIKPENNIIYECTFQQTRTDLYALNYTYTFEFKEDSLVDLKSDKMYLYEHEISAEEMASIKQENDSKEDERVNLNFKELAKDKDSNEFIKELEERGFSCQGKN